MSVRKPSRVVVADGTGGVGEGVVVAFARGGFEVLVPSRSEEKIATLSSALPPDAQPRVRGDVVDTDHVSTIERYRDALISGGGPIDAVVGGRHEGGLLRAVRVRRNVARVDRRETAGHPCPA